MSEDLSDEEAVAARPTGTQTGADNGGSLPPLPLSLPLLLALSTSPGGLGLLPLLFASGAGDKGIKKAEKIKRDSLIERYGQQAGRFRETTGNVAAIDFGTTFCSVAYTTDADEICTLQLNHYHSRVPTAILLKQNGSNSIQNFDADDPIIRSPVYEVLSFGYDAQEQHAKLRATERNNHLYFERFKMSLQQDEVSVSHSILINITLILINRV